MEILTRFLTDGKVMVLPKKQKNRRLVFEYIYEHIKKQGSSFSEKEINSLIAEVYDDYVTMRRFLVDYGYLLRDDYGKEYVVKG